MEGYAHTKYVIIDNRGASQALTGKPVLLELSPANFTFAEAKADGADLRFTTDGTTLLPYWIESYSTTAARIWIRVQGVGAGSAAALQMHWGNASAPAVSSFDATMTTVDALTGCAVAYLFSEGAGTSLADAKGGSAATLNGGWTAHPQSASRYGALLSAEGHCMTIPNLLDTPTTAGTLGFTWIPDGAYGAGNGGRLFSKYNSATNYIDAYISDADGLIYINIVRGGTSKVMYAWRSTWSAGVAYQFTLTWDATFTRLYINGVYEDRQFTTLPQSGTQGAFTLGALNNGTTISNTLKGAYTDFFVLNRSISFAEVKAICEHRPYYQKDMASKVEKSYYPHYPGTGIEAQAVAEPSVLYEGGKHRMWFAKGTSPANLVYNESTDLQTWGTEQVLIENAGRACTVKHNGTYYHYYLPGGNGAVMLRESTDGTTLGATAYEALSATAEDFSGYSNVGVAADPSDPNVWHMIAEGYKPATSYVWANCYYRSTNGPRGPFLPVSGTTNPRATMQQGGLTSNNAQLFYVNGGWHIIQHARNQAGGNVSGGYKDRMGLSASTTPSDHFALTTTDFNTFSFRYGGEAFMKVEDGAEVDQLGDPHLWSDGTQCYMAYTNVDNGLIPSAHTAYYKIAFARVPVKLSQFFCDLGVSLSATATLPGELSDPVSDTPAPVISGGGDVVAMLLMMM